MIKKNRKKLTVIEWFKNRSAVMPESETKEMFRMAISALKKQETDRWIPVTERLPKKPDDYFVTIVYCGKKYVDICKFIVCDSNDSFWTYQNVIAWRPLPKAYMEEEI